MVAKSGACEKIYLIDCVPSTTAAVRSMCRITMAHTMKHRITSKSLLERLGAASFDSYSQLLHNRRLVRYDLRSDLEF